jgi:hypothetical protein
MKFWQWYSISTGDSGVVQISTNDGATWTTVSRRSVVTAHGDGWSQACVDLSAYAGQTVRIAFYFRSDASGQDWGWYIDDISITNAPEVFNNPETFENGVGDWCAENGLWEVGAPLGGPDAPHGGANCAGTVLSNHYTQYANTRLISTPVSLIPLPGQQPQLLFYHWFSISSGDTGIVQVQRSNGIWQNVGQAIVPGASGGWTLASRDLSAFSDSTVRIAFLFQSNQSGQDWGWYIDDVQVSGIAPPGQIIAVIQKFPDQQHVRVSWSRWPGATQYRVYNDPVANGPYTNFVTVSAPTLSTILDAPTPGRQFFKVTAITP